MLAEHGVDVNKGQSDDNIADFPLFTAAHNKDMRLVRCLIDDCGVDINKTNNVSTVFTFTFHMNYL